MTRDPIDTLKATLVVLRPGPFLETGATRWQPN